jgi:hypothetical protein
VKRASKLDPFKPYLMDRTRAGVWNARVLSRELQARLYQRLHDSRGLAAFCSAHHFSSLVENFSYAIRLAFLAKS